jgi:hypothetical protein
VIAILKSSTGPSDNFCSLKPFTIDEIERDEMENDLKEYMRSTKK